MGIENLIAAGPAIQPLDPVQSLTRALSLRDLMQQRQINQQLGQQGLQEGALKLAQAHRAEADDQATRQIFMNRRANPTAPVAGAAPHPDAQMQSIVDDLEGKGLYSQAAAMRKQVIDNAEKRSIAQKNVAQAGDYDTKVQTAKHQALANSLNSVLQLPDDQIQAGYSQQLARLAAGPNPILSPQEAAEAQQFPGRAALQQHYQSLMHPDVLQRMQGEAATQKRAEALAPSQLAESKAKAAQAEVLSKQYQDLGMPKHEADTLAQTKVRDANTVRHEKVEEGLGQRRANIAAGEFGLQQKRFNATLGAGLDTNGQPLSPEAQKAVAMQDPLAVAQANYGAPPPGLSRTTPLGAAQYRKIIAINPTYDPTQFQARNKTAQDFSPAGKSGQAITSADTALAHLDTVSKAGAALKNGNFPALNGLANSLGVQIGHSPQQTYDTIVAMVAPEISKAVIGAAGGEAERMAMQHNFTSKANDQQREGAIGAAAQLLGARVHKQAQAYESQMGRPMERKLSPESQQLLDRYSGGKSSGGAKSGYSVGDTVNYNGAPHKVKAIKADGKLVLE